MLSKQLIILMESLYNDIQDINYGCEKGKIDDEEFHHWKAGEGYIIAEDLRHLGTNAGMEDKYTLQVSGFLK